MIDAEHPPLHPAVDAPSPRGVVHNPGDLKPGGHLFVDREAELAELEANLAQALSGHGRVCFVAGQAGSGKTALVRHFVEHAFAANPDVILAMGVCNAQTGTGDPYLPFREALTMLTGSTSTEQPRQIPAENSRRLKAVLVRSVQVLVEVAPELVGAFVPGAKLLGAFGKAVAEKVGWMDRLEGLVKQKTLAAASVQPVAEQGRIFEQYTAFLQRLSEQAPVILFLDDLQWADGASINLLFHLGRHLEKSHTLILGAYRPNDVALGRDGKRHPLEPVVNEFTRYYGDVSIDLDALSEESNRRFVAALLDAEPNCLGADFRQALYHRTGGHALFTVELIRAMRERGDLVRDAQGCWVERPSLDWSLLPARVEGVIEERIGRLSPELAQVLQVASVEGEEFTAEVVARVQATGDREMVRQLSRELERRHRLIDGEGVVRLGRMRMSRYRFAHNLFYHYLYDGLSAAERSYLHHDVGLVLEDLFAGQTDQVAAQLARHFDEAGVPDKAASYRLQAGDRARRISAYQEAMTHLLRGLELVESLPAATRPTELELNLHVSLGMVLIALYGYASPRVDRVFSRARELCRALGDPPQSVQVLLAQAAFSLMRGDIDRARQDAQHVLSLAQQAADTASVMTSHLMLGAANSYLADYGRARQHLEKAIALYDPVQHRDLAYLHGQDPGVRALSFLARVLWLQGHPRQAVARQKEALELAEELDHPYSHTVAVLHAATLYAMIRHWSLCQAEAERALLLARQGDFHIWQADAAILHGLSLAHQHRTEEGIAELSRNLFLWEASGAGLVAYGRTCLADAYCAAGRQQEGLRAVDEALYPGKEIWWRPEQLRIRAELLLLTPGNETRAEALLRQAAALARDQEARSLELRALTGLARLLQRRGQEAKAGQRLAECYARFDEGFDHPDLQDARQYLPQPA
jgi:predicted ATPase